MFFGPDDIYNDVLPCCKVRHVPTAKDMVRFDLNEFKVFDLVVEGTSRNSSCKWKRGE